MLFRAAAPGDASALGDFLYLADLSHYETSGFAVSLGGSRQYQIETLAKLAQTEARSQFHYSHFDVATTDDGTPVASVAGFDRSQTDAQGAAALEQIGWTPNAIEGLVERIGPVGIAFPPEEPSTWTIEHVATLPAYRRQGLSRQLLERVVARGFEQGYKHACVDVFDGNDAARALYETAGFRPNLSFGQEPLRRILGRDALIRLVRRSPL